MGGCGWCGEGLNVVGRLLLWPSAFDADTEINVEATWQRAGGVLA